MGKALPTIRERLAALGGPVARSYVVVAAAMAADSLVYFLFPPYLDTLGVPVNVIGLLVAVSSLAALASRLPAGVLYRGSRARGLLLSALAIGVAATLALPLVTDPWVFAGLRLAAGLAYGVITTTNLARFIEALPPAVNRARAMGYYSSALAVGLVFGNGVGGYVAEWFGYAVAFRSAALFYVLAAGVALTLPAPAARSPAAARATASAPPLSVWGRLAALRDPGMLTVASAALLISFMQIISGAFLPLYGIGVGLALAEVAAIRATGSLMNVFGRAGAGPLLQRLGRRRLQPVGLGLQAVGLIAYSFCAGFWPLLAAMLWVATWRSIVLVANTIALTEDVDEARVSRGLASGVYNAATDLGQIVGPAVGGAVAAAVGLDWMLRLLPPVVFLAYLAVLATATRRGIGPVRAAADAQSG